ncbi:hypothetical protein PAPHI01_2671 [Pancytospora philotis]|nr:hypothetical protein PAPHI01_2671 [Pancytospora philotis]
MREQGLELNKLHDVNEAATVMDNIVRAHEKRLDMHTKRKEFHKQNVQFELNRRYFYRNLSGEHGSTHDVPAEDVKAFWSTMWNKPETKTDADGAERWLRTYDAGPKEPVTFPSRSEFSQII